MLKDIFSMKQLLESGVHFGHHPRRWNPKMEPYIYGTYNSVHIINLEKTAVLLREALKVTRDIVSKGGRVLFVGTKRQASEVIAKTAVDCGQYYVNFRWLGGMLTNWKTIRESINQLKKIDGMLESSYDEFTKKELLRLTNKRNKLENVLGGIKEMGTTPDLVIVIDVLKEHIAVTEAAQIGIPVIGIIDTNGDPDLVNYPVPGNDDSIRSISLYCNLFKESVLQGVEVQLNAMNDESKLEKKRDVAVDIKEDAEVSKSSTSRKEATLNTESSKDKILEESIQEDTNASNSEDVINKDSIKNNKSVAKVEKTTKKDIKVSSATIVEKSSKSQKMINKAADISAKKNKV